LQTYYWNSRKNFGDALTSLLIKKFTRLESVWCPPEYAELVMVGSILEHLPPDYTGVIAGAGKLHESTRLNFGLAKVLAVRGPLTAKGMKGNNIILADPGLIADELVGEQEKLYDLGIVPHWSDTALERNPIFTKYNPHIIRVSEDPLKVIKEIGQCKKIVSSSLHGIVLADAFSIPRRIEIAPKMLSHPKQEGGIFKWKDYSASLGVPLKIGVTQEIDKHKIMEKQYEIFDILEEIKSIFR
jgi:hypothetical protein